jgi:hypothetical protein
MKLKLTQCDHLRCTDCGDLEADGMTVRQMLEAARDHVVNEHTDDVLAEFPCAFSDAVDAVAARLCYVQRCAHWTA